MRGKIPIAQRKRLETQHGPERFLHFGNFGIGYFLIVKFSGWEPVGQLLKDDAHDESVVTLGDSILLSSENPRQMGPSESNLDPGT